MNSDKSRLVASGLDKTIFSLVNRARIKKISVAVKSWSGRLLLENVAISDGHFKVDVGQDLAKLDGKLFILCSCLIFNGPSPALQLQFLQQKL